jgi:uncharacterized protein (TIGR03083 family)
MVYGEMDPLTSAERAGRFPQRVPEGAARAGEPAAVTREQSLTGLMTAYRSVTSAVTGLEAEQFLLPTRCAGWAVVDLLYHLLLDAQRALVALATPSDSAADTDYVTYWRPFGGVPMERAAEGAARHARAVRVIASALPPADLVEAWDTTSRAALRAARAVAADSRLSTQRHVLALPDLLTTLAVEATVHLLDLTVDLPDRPQPEPDPLRLVRRTLDGLLGAGTVRPDWDDTTYALKGTGRLPLVEADRKALGPSADRFPLFR